MTCRPPLSAVMGLINSIFVATVATVTLGVALTISLGTINENGERAVVSHTTTAAFQLDLRFSTPKKAMVDVAGVCLRFADCPTPTEHKSFGDTIAPAGYVAERFTNALVGKGVAGNWSWIWFSVNFLDGTFIASVSVDGFPAYVKLLTYVASNGNRVNQDSAMEKKTGNDMGNASADASFMVNIAAPQIERPDMRDNSYVQQQSGFVEGATFSEPRWSAPLLTYQLGVPYYIVMLVAKVRNHTHDFIGMSNMAITLEGIGDLLQAARVTKDTVAFAVDKRGYLLGASDSTSVHWETVWNPGDPVPSGCTTTAVSAAVISSSQLPQGKDHIGCQYHMTSSPFQALSDALENAGDILEKAGTSIEAVLSISGDSYLVAQQLPSLARAVGEFNVVLLVLVPRSDILGDAALVLLKSLGATFVTALLVAVLSVAIVWLVLSPLRPIAVRMGKAARLEEDDVSEKYSWIREIADLQIAFDEMAGELNRIRSFVPQSLLKATQDDDDDSDEDRLSTAENSKVSNVMTVVSPEDTDGRCHRHSIRSLQSRTSAASAMPNVQGGKRVVSMHTRTCDGVRTEQVTIMCLNLRDFSDAAKIADQTLAALHVVRTAPQLNPTLVAETVQTVMSEVDALKGVIDFFHGDRFTVSFNASRHAAGGGTRAARVAARLSGALPKTGLRLDLSSGIATGPAVIGNVGCSGMKRFTVFGSVVARAGVLERLCKLHHSVTCLVPHRLFADLETAVNIESVDFVSLPGCVKPCLIGSVSGEQAGIDTGEVEWMYQLEEQSQNVDKRTADKNAATKTYNETWGLIAQGLLEKARERLDGASLPEETGTTDRVIQHRHQRLLAHLGECKDKPRPLGLFYDSSFF